jgi:hypothetical protein
MTRSDYCRVFDEIPTKLSVQHVQPISNDSIFVYPPESPKSSVYFVMQQLKRELSTVVVEV